MEAKVDLILGPTRGDDPIGVGYFIQDVEELIEKWEEEKEQEEQKMSNTKKGGPPGDVQGCDVADRGPARDAEQHVEAQLQDNGAAGEGDRGTTGWTGRR